MAPLLKAGHVSDETHAPEEPRGLLEELAAAKGVDAHWWDWRGEHRRVPGSALRAVLEAMGEDVTDDAATATALERVRTAPWRRTLPPTVVQREGDPLRLLVHVPHGSAVTVHVQLEGGGRRDLVQVEHVVRHGAERAIGLQIDLEGAAGQAPAQGS